jgi:DNA-binding Xre family transcriptional regulator
VRHRQPRLPFPRRCRFVRQEAIAQVLRERCLTHQDLAGLLGLHPSTWSTLFNRHRPLTLRARTLLLCCPALDCLGEADLWETVELPPKDSP